MKNVGIDDFYNSGYLNLAVKGSEAIINNSIQARKSAVLFISKLIISYDSNKILIYVLLFLFRSIASHHHSSKGFY